MDQLFSLAPLYTSIVPPHILDNICVHFPCLHAPTSLWIPKDGNMYEPLCVWSRETINKHWLHELRVDRRGPVCICPFVGSKARIKAFFLLSLRHCRDGGKWFSKNNDGAGQMAYRIRALVWLRTQVWFPESTASTKVCNFNFIDPTPTFGFHRHHTWMLYVNIHVGKVSIHISIKFKNSHWAVLVRAEHIMWP